MIRSRSSRSADTNGSLPTAGAMAFGQIVDDHDVVAALGEQLGRVRADVAGPACD